MVDDVKLVLVAVDEIALHLVRGMKDGVFKDFEELWTAFQTDPDFQAKVMAGYRALGKVQPELQNMGLLDSISLIETEVAYIPAFIKALHGGTAQAEAPVAVDPTPAS